VSSLRTPLGQGDGCECEWVDDAKAYNWTVCPIHYEAEQAAYDKWQAREAAWLAACRAAGVHPHTPEGRKLRPSTYSEV